MDSQFINKNIENKPFFEKLNSDIECDFVIVGGGISGCLMAKQLNDCGKKTILLEQDRIASRYTAYNNSCITYDFNIPFFSAKRSQKKEEPIRKTYELIKSSMEKLDEIIDQIEPCDYKKKDLTIFSTRKTDIKRFENEAKLINECGINCYLINNTNSLPTAKMKVGINFEDGAREFNPIKFCYNTLDLCNNIQIFEQTRAEYIDYGEDFVKVITDDKFHICAKKVIFTCPNFMQTEEKASFFITNTLYTIITNKIDALSDSLKKNIIFNYDKQPIIYKEIDGRIMVAKVCTNYESEEEKADVFDFLKRKLCSTLPNMKNCQIDFEDKCKFIETKDNLPYIFKDTAHKELIYMLCVGRSGIIFSTLCSELISKWCLDENNLNYDLFSLDR